MSAVQFQQPSHGPILHRLDPTPRTESVWSTSQTHHFFWFLFLCFHGLQLVSCKVDLLLRPARLSVSSPPWVFRVLQVAMRTVSLHLKWRSKRSPDRNRCYPGSLVRIALVHVEGVLRRVGCRLFTLDAPGMSIRAAVTGSASLLTFPVCNFACIVCTNPGVKDPLKT